ncbi:CHASE2 domain-containing protein [Dasania sp. GY-MA-18]|uniref:histidine kinase n=1 Tax=Dasania phycosphaerae TaxID=2950436 RepID=A0A9J6RG41_9GAMM|nr:MULTISPECIES: CHASE2 domain-containing protein [Dasania]MCR8921194.1 CHASE2 domain-containing protein [Dasania sp. GY-MA-18]MCZ0863622.1 CHASE2 and HATPase_c domain-containing protein [Dasania phycosphaerae]MCZ0867350.1 CHASE2 and HATPase_c domain-containing protein [Dasania phycosphaerae]
MWLSSHNISKQFDWLLYDQVQQFSQLPAANDIVIVNIDEKSIATLGRWPWPRDKHAQLITQLQQAGAKAIAFDIIFADSDSNNPEADLAFAQAIADHGKVLLPLYIKQISLQGQVLEVPPAPLFYRAAHSIGHVHVAPNEDGVVRSLFLKEGVNSAYWPHLSLALWQMLAGPQPLPGSQQAAANTTSQQQYIIRDFHNFLPMPGPQQGLRHVSYSDVINAEVDSSLLKHSLVFVGASAAGLGDTITTPIGTMNGVEFNAWAFHALRNGVLIQQLNRTTLIICHSISVFILLLILGRLSPRAFLTATLLSIIGLVTISALLQLQAQLWLAISPIIIALLAFYPLWSWRRLEVALHYLCQEMNDLESSPITTALAISANKKPSTKAKGSELVSQTINRLKQLRNIAQTNQRLMQKSLEQLNDAVIISNTSGRIILSNQAFAEMISPTEQQQQDLYAALSNIELQNYNWPSVINDLQINSPAFALQGTHKHSGKDLFCQGHVAAINSSHNDTFIISITDVSQLKAAEKSRIEALNFLSHDLRSPMVSVLAIIEQQQKHTNPQQQALANIALLVQKNLSYAESFLQLNRAEAITHEQLHLCDLHSVFDSAQTQAIALAHSKNINIITQRSNEDAWVLGDNNLLERALINLLSNAIKYSPANSKVSLSLIAEDEQLLLQVCDQGCGINADELPTLFDRYTRAKQHQHEMGSGLGLHFVATVAHKHQGQIEVSSQLGEGSCFTLKLPKANPV